MNVDSIIKREQRLAKIEDLFKRAEAEGDWQVMVDLAALAEVVNHLE